MAVVTLVAVAGIVAGFEQFLLIFNANYYLNGGILAVFFVGVLTCFLQVFQAWSCVGWLRTFAVSESGEQTRRPPQILVPLASLLAPQSSRIHIGFSSTRSILDSVATRLDESKDVSRYIINLLIFLGLLGTFYGLATTIPSVVETIGNLAENPGDTGQETFSRLLMGLEEQLGGMGTAFASSLFGLAGSLVVGLLDLFAGHGQGRFYRELEEWLSTITRVGFAADGEASGSESGVAVAAMELMEQHMHAIRGAVEHSSQGSAHVADRVSELAEALRGQPGGAPPESAEAQIQLLLRIAEGQDRLAAALEALRKAGAEEGADAETRMRLKSMDVQLLKILEEMSAGRQDVMEELRIDLKEITRLLYKATGEEPPSPGKRRSGRG